MQYIVILLSSYLHTVEAYRRPPFSPTTLADFSCSLGPSSSVRCPLAAPAPLSVLVSPTAPAQPPEPPPPTEPPSPPPPTEPPSPPLPLPVLPLPLPVPEPVLLSLLCGLSLPPAAHGLLLPPRLPPAPAPVPVPAPAPDPPEWVGHTDFLSVLAPVL